MLFAQNVDFCGNIIYERDSSDFVGAHVTLLKNGVVIADSVSDEKGYFVIKNVQIGNYDILIRFIGFKVKLIKNIEINTNHKKINCTFPDLCKSSKKICPFGHKDNLIPIVFGLPTQKMFRKSKMGKISLGGCLVSECNPEWYCKVHQIEF